MGYRSEVYVRIEYEAIDIQKELTLSLLAGGSEFGEHFKNIKDNIDEFDEDSHISNNSLILIATDWKWYESYDLVASVEYIYRYFAELAEENDSVGCAFIRVGEDSDDTECKYENGGYEFGHIERYICIPD